MRKIPAWIERPYRRTGDEETRGCNSYKTKDEKKTAFVPVVEDVASFPGDLSPPKVAVGCVEVPKSEEKKILEKLVQLYGEAVVQLTAHLDKMSRDFQEVHAQLDEQKEFIKNADEESLTRFARELADFRAVTQRQSTEIHDALAFLGKLHKAHQDDKLGELNDILRSNYAGVIRSHTQYVKQWEMSINRLRFVTALIVPSLFDEKEMAQIEAASGYSRPSWLRKTIVGARKAVGSAVSKLWEWITSTLATLWELLTFKNIALVGIGVTLFFILGGPGLIVSVFNAISTIASFKKFRDITEWVHGLLQDFCGMLRDANVYVSFLIFIFRDFLKQLIIYLIDNPIVGGLLSAAGTYLTGGLSKLSFISNLVLKHSDLISSVGKAIKDSGAKIKKKARKQAATTIVLMQVLTFLFFHAFLLFARPWLESGCLSVQSLFSTFSTVKSFTEVGHGWWNWAWAKTNDVVFRLGGFVEENLGPPSDKDKRKGQEEAARMAGATEDAMADSASGKSWFQAFTDDVWKQPTLAESWKKFASTFRVFLVSMYQGWVRLVAGKLDVQIKRLTWLLKTVGPDGVLYGDKKFKQQQSAEVKTTLDLWKTKTEAFIVDEKTNLVAEAARIEKSKARLEELKKLGSWTKGFRGIREEQNLGLAIRRDETALAKALSTPATVESMVTPEIKQLRELDATYKEQLETWDEDEKKWKRLTDEYKFEPMKWIKSHPFVSLGIVIVTSVLAYSVVTMTELPAPSRLSSLYRLPTLSESLDADYDSHEGESSGRRRRYAYPRLRALMFAAENAKWDTSLSTEEREALQNKLEVAQLQLSQDVGDNPLFLEEQAQFATEIDALKASEDGWKPDSHKIATEYEREAGVARRYAKKVREVEKKRLEAEAKRLEEEEEEGKEEAVPKSRRKSRAERKADKAEEKVEKQLTLAAAKNIHFGIPAGILEEIGGFPSPDLEEALEPPPQPLPIEEQPFELADVEYPPHKKHARPIITSASRSRTEPRPVPSSTISTPGRMLLLQAPKSSRTGKERLAPVRLEPIVTSPSRSHRNRRAKTRSTA